MNKIKECWANFKSWVSPSYGEFIGINDVTSKDKGFTVNVRLTKKVKRSFSKEIKIYKRNVDLELRKLGYHDKFKSVFHFRNCECPELSHTICWHEMYAYLTMTPCWKYPFMPIYDHQVKKLVDEWWEERGFKVDGKWD